MPAVRWIIPRLSFSLALPSFEHHPRQSTAEQRRPSQGEGLRSLIPCSSCAAEGDQSDVVEGISARRVVVNLPDQRFAHLRRCSRTLGQQGATWPRRTDRPRGSVRR